MALYAFVRGGEKWGVFIDFCSLPQHCDPDDGEFRTAAAKFKTVDAAVKCRSALQNFQGVPPKCPNPLPQSIDAYS